MPLIKAKAKRCPFCNSKPEVKPYPNNLGYSVECTNDECEMWGHKFDLDGWNNRKNSIKDIIQYLFDITTVFETANFKTVYRYVCKCCGAEARTKKSIKHAKDCKIKRFLQNASR